MKKLIISFGMAVVVLASYYQETASWELSQYDKEPASLGFQARSKKDTLLGTALIKGINGGYFTPNKMLLYACLPKNTAGYWAEVLEGENDNLQGGGDWYDKNNKLITPPKGGERLISAISTSCAREWPEWAKAEVRQYMAFLGIII